MHFFRLAAAALAWLGRQGTRAVAISIFVGLAVPQFAAFLKPYVGEQIFLLLCLAFLRVEPAALRAHASRPSLVLLATAWTMLVIPAALWGAFAVLGLAERAPDLLFGLVLQAIAPPVLSATAFAALLGLDAALALTMLALSFAVTPLTSPPFARAMLGPALEISPVALGIRLFLLMAGAALVGALIRRLVGTEFLQRQKESIDGLNVIVMFTFAAALMDGVLGRIIAEPLLVFGLVCLAFTMSFGLMAVTMLAFSAIGRADAMAIALSTGHRNMGLIVAAMGGAIPDLTWLYFAIVQFPVYLNPHLLRPLIRRLADGSAGKK